MPALLGLERLVAALRSLPIDSFGARSFTDRLGFVFASVLDGLRCRATLVGAACLLGAASGTGL